jgi:hypothetical protein
VQQSLFETNADWHMERALAHLKRANPDSWRLVRVIVVDKDLNEIKVLKRCFEEAQVLICHFHVIKYLGKVSKKPEYNKTSTEDHKALDNSIHSLVYSESADVYDDNRLAFMLVCDRVGMEAFNKYVEKNWFNSPDMWVMYLRDKLPHLRNHTNNRLESWFGKFKKDVPDNASMSECVKFLIDTSERCQRDYEYLVTRPGMHYNAQYDKEMQTVLSISTPFVAEAVRPEYETAINKFEVYQYEESVADNYVVVKGKTGNHTVYFDDWRCGCKTAKTMLLPCRHAMAYRRHNNFPEVIPLGRIDLRCAHVCTMFAPCLVNIQLICCPSQMEACQDCPS